MAGISELVDFVSNKTGASKKDAREAVDAVLDGVVSCTSVGGNLILRGFGTFAMRTVKAKKGRNPQTGAVIDIPEKIKLAFKQAK